MRRLQGKVVEDEAYSAGLDVGNVQDRLGLPEEILARGALIVPELHDGHRSVGIPQRHALGQLDQLLR